MPINREKVQKEAERLVGAGKIEAGIAQYQLLVSENPRDLGTLNKIGDLYVRLNKKADAIKSFTRIAEIYADDGFFLKAIAIYKKVNKIDPSHIETIQRLADLYSKQGLKTEARAQYLVVAEALVKSGQAPKAVAVYESLVALEPENFKHRLALAELKMKHGRKEEAAKTLTELAQDLERKGMAKESAKVYEMALAAGGGDASMAEGLCASLAASGQHEKALSVVEQALRRAPGSAGLLTVKGISLAELGRAAEGEAALRAALSKEPGRSDASLALARLQAGRKQAREAHATVAAALDGIMSAGKGPEAVKVLEAVHAADPSSRAVLEDLYRLQTMLGNKAGTLFTGEKLLEICVDEGRHSEALALARRLAELEPTNPARRERLRKVEAIASGKAAPSPARAAAAPAEVIEEEEEAEEEIELSGETLSAETPEAAGPEPEPEPEPEPVYQVPQEMPAEPPAVEGAAFQEPELSLEDDDFISEHLTEAEVFVKYGLADRAAEQLSAIVQRFPWHVGARQRLRDVYLEEGNRARAAGETAAMGRILLERGDRAGAEAALAEARSIDASCPALTEVEALLQGEAPVATRPRPARAPSAPVEEGVDLVIEEEGAEEAGAVRAAGPHAAPPAEDLQEFDFYLAQGMRAEAAAILSRLEASAGPHPEIESRRAALGRAAAEAYEAPEVEVPAGADDVEEAEEEVLVEGEEPAAEEAPAGKAARPVAAEVAADATAKSPSAAADFFDLTELGSSLFSAEEATEEEAALTSLEATPEGHSLEEIVSAFKKGIEQQVGSEDYGTHYDLGIAYKEMGLLEEAIAEFQFASKDPQRMSDCCSMLGICFREKGMLPLAVRWYRKGLEALANGGDEERLNGLRFDLAEVLEQMGEYRQALDLFVEVYGVDSRYRDVAAKIKEIEKRLSG